MKLQKTKFVKFVFLAVTAAQEVTMSLRTSIFSMFLKNALKCLPVFKRGLGQVNGGQLS